METPNHARAALVTLAALGLGIGLLAALPARSVAGSHTVPTTTTSVTTTTVASTATTTTTTAAVTGARVAIMAPAGAPTEAAVRSKLVAAHDVLVSQAPIPYSWVSSLTSPLVRYPAGFTSDGLKVAATLGVPAGTVTEELSGTSVGANVIEVFLPPT